MHLLPGKQVWELMPSTHAGKWPGMQWILRRQRAGWSRRMLLFYFGDDVTDERVFRTIGSISAVAGKRRGTAARYFLRSAAEARGLLEKLRETLP